MKDNKKITIAGRTLHLTFTMRDWERMEDEICTLEELDKKMKAQGRIQLVYQLTEILAHDELVTANWLALNIKPYQFTMLIDEINRAIITGMTHKDDENAVHDVGLEELAKNGAGAD